MEKARKISLALCIAAAAIFSGYNNIYGGVSIIIVNYEKYGKIGIALLISSLFLIAGIVFAAYQKVWIPLVFNIIGTAAYIYSVSQLYAIPNTLIPKEKTEPLAERHLFTVIVTVLLIALTFFNFFSDENVKARQERRNKKAAEQDRPLEDSEKII